jgi:hypothetical protein
MLRRTATRCGGGSGGRGPPAIASSPGPALGLGNAPIFRVSRFFRPVDAAPASSAQVAAEGVRTGRDAAAASVIDFIELQWALIPYRFRKLVLEGVEARRLGLVGSLPDLPQLVAIVAVLAAAYAIALRVGRWSLFELEAPPAATPGRASSTSAAAPAAAAAAAKH